MDVDDHNGGGHSNDNNIWDWQGEEYSLQRCPQSELSHFVWDEVNQNGPDFLCMLEEQTPIKECADLECQGSNVEDSKNEHLEAYSASQLKRRRMLQFTPDASEIGIADEQNNSVFLNSEVMDCSMIENGIAESLEWNTQWTLGFSDDRCAIDCNDFDQLSDGWLVDCLNESEMRHSPDEMYNNVAFNQQADISECYDDPPSTETDPVPEPSAPPGRVVKGTKSYIKSPRNLTTTSVAYPFALIKPCGVQGVLTLDDINQRIHGPRPSRLKHKKDDDPSVSCPTSALSGKPVVVKTKIRTEGGQGSITITRTKG